MVERLERLPETKLRDADYDIKSYENKSFIDIRQKISTELADKIKTLNSYKSILLKLTNHFQEKLTEGHGASKQPAREEAGAISPEISQGGKPAGKKRPAQKTAEVVPESTTE